MADDQVTLSYSNDVFTIVSGSDAGQQANYSGSVTVDYTTGTYTGLNFDVQGFGENGGFGDKGGNYGGTLGVSGNNYSVTGGGFTLYWTGMTPRTARAVLVANGNDTYDTQANPSEQGTQPVTSTVNSTSDACFASGTAIRTAAGNLPVQSLTVGDLVVATSGATCPIRWIGHRTIRLAGHPRARELRPIRIAAQAFCKSSPTRDLYVSPGHAICVDVLGEVLIPAGLLVNGSTIEQVEVDEVTYWHVELEGGHDVILAENLPAESYLDMGNRGFFREAGVVDLTAGPDVNSAQRTHADFCRPYVDDGHILDAVRARLAARAETMMNDAQQKAA